MDIKKDIANPGDASTEHVSPSDCVPVRQDIAATSFFHIAPGVLYRTLEGVIVATKIDAGLLSPILEWILSFGDLTSGNAVSNTSVDKTAVEWLHLAKDRCGEDHLPLRLINLAIGIISLRQAHGARGRASSAEAIDRAWMLIHEALTIGTPICAASRSAQGFLSVALCSLIKDGNIDELWRLHVWLPDGERGVADFAIHSHQLFAESWILAGEGRDYSYVVTPTTDKTLATHATYRLTWNDGKSSNTSYKTHQVSSSIVNSGELVSTTLKRSELHRRNSNYTIPSAAYHRSEIQPDAIHATVFVFDSSRGFQKDAPVLGPPDGEALEQQRDPAGVTPAALAELADTVRSWEKLMDEGARYSQEVEWEFALREFQKALLKIDNHQGIPLPARYRSLTLFQLGNTSRRFGKYEKAQSYLESAIETMPASLDRVEVSGELGVVYRHTGDLEKARDAFQDQYNTADQLHADRAMCRAIGNLGMVNYQLFLKDQNHDPDRLGSAIRQLLERVKLARSIKAKAQREGQRPDQLAQIVNWETIGLARLSLCYSAQGDSDLAIAAAKESLDLTMDTKDATVRALSHFFYGHALRYGGMPDEALAHFNLNDTCTPAMAFCQEPSDEYRGYLQEVIDAGANLELVDHRGYTVLDYAMYSGDKATQELIIKGLRKALILKAENDLQARITEVQVRKAYRELFQEKLRPALLQKKDHKPFSSLRKSYAAELTSDPTKQVMFDRLKFIHYQDFARAGQLPSSRNDVVHAYPAGVGESNAVDYLIFISYRWINKRLIRLDDKKPANLSPDDERHTQYSRMMNAVHDFLAKHRQVDEEKLGIWMDFACVDQSDPTRGVQALPMIIVQCDAMISLVDDIYYSRAWCSVEIMVIQKLKRAYGLHLWYEQVPLGSDKDEPGWPQKYELREGNIDFPIVLSEKHLTFESDRSRILFLERQMKLLT